MSLPNVSPLTRARVDVDVDVDVCVCVCVSCCEWVPGLFACVGEFNATAGVYVHAVYADHSASVGDVLLFTHNHSKHDVVKRLEEGCGASAGNEHITTTLDGGECGSDCYRHRITIVYSHSHIVSSPPFFKMVPNILI